MEYLCVKRFCCLWCTFYILGGYECFRWCIFNKRVRLRNHSPLNLILNRLRDYRDFFFKWFTKLLCGSLWMWCFKEVYTQRNFPATKWAIYGNTRPCFIIIEVQSVINTASVIRLSPVFHNFGSAPPPTFVVSLQKVQISPFCIYILIDKN